MKNWILHGFHEELHCLGDSWGIGFFMDFMKNSLFVCFVNNWILTGFQEEQHVSRNLWRIAFFVDFMIFCVGFTQNCFLQGSISSRIAFFRTHEELYSSWIPWRIALLMGFVTNCSAFGLRRELLSSQIWWTISFFEDSMKNCILRASQAEPYIFHSLHKLRLGFAIEPWRAVFFMDFMKNCILPGFLQKCFI